MNGEMSVDDPAFQAGGISVLVGDQVGVEFLDVPAGHEILALPLDQHGPHVRVTLEAVG